MIEIELNNLYGRAVHGEERLAEAVRRVLTAAGFATGQISLAVVSDDEIHALNRQWLAHDYPTDVISFVLESAGQHLEGEVIVSFDTACKEAAKYDWQPADELLLYVIHGALHLVGYDDLDDESRRQMRAAEARHLAEWNLRHRFEEDEPPDAAGPQSTAVPECGGHPR